MDAFKAARKWEQMRSRAKVSSLGWFAVSSLPQKSAQLSLVAWADTGSSAIISSEPSCELRAKWPVWVCSVRCNDCCRWASAPVVRWARLCATRANHWVRAERAANQQVQLIGPVCICECVCVCVVTSPAHTKLPALVCVCLCVRANVLQFARSRPMIAELQQCATTTTTTMVVSAVSVSAKVALVTQTARFLPTTTTSQQQLQLERQHRQLFLPTSERCQQVKPLAKLACFCKLSC